MIQMFTKHTMQNTIYDLFNWPRWTITFTRTVLIFAVSTRYMPTCIRLWEFWGVGKSIHICTCHKQIASNPSQICLIMCDAFSARTKRMSPPTWSSDLHQVNFEILDIYFLILNLTSQILYNSLSHLKQVISTFKF